MCREAVQVDHVQAAYAPTFEPFGHFQRILVVDLFTLVVALGETHALPVDDVYGRNQFYHKPVSESSMKFFNIRSPTFPLFSGWNWVAKKFPFCKEALKGSI